MACRCSFSWCKTAQQIPSMMHFPPLQLNGKTDSIRMMPSSSLTLTYCEPITTSSRLDAEDVKFSTTTDRRGTTKNEHPYYGTTAAKGSTTANKMGTSISEAMIKKGGDNNYQVATAGGWRAQVLQASNIASLLCVLDCTVLPVVTVALPFLGLVDAASPAQLEFLHELGHSVALWFVLPVGGSVTLLNYSLGNNNDHKQHQQKKRIAAALGMLGLLLVLAANAPHSWLHQLKEQTSSSFLALILYPLLHAVHHGIAHRMVNISGCACLLTGNYLSKQQQQSGKCLLGNIKYHNE